MKSKFTIKSYLAQLLIIAFIIFLYNILPIYYKDPYREKKLLSEILVPGLSVIAIIFLVFGELRTKIIKVELDEDEVIVKRFFGLITKRYSNSDIDGWKYSLLPSKGGTYEYLYLYKDNRKCIKLSEFYHKNYHSLKEKIQIEYKFLGNEQFSFFDEMKEMFT